jgi:type VI secretion system protein ImpK
VAPLAFAAGAAAVTLLVVYIVLRLVLAQTGGPAMAALEAVNPDSPLRLSRVAAVPLRPRRAGRRSASARSSRPRSAKGSCA